MVRRDCGCRQGATSVVAAAVALLALAAAFLRGARPLVRCGAAREGARAEALTPS
jgi:hypothetical protein